MSSNGEQDISLCVGAGDCRVTSLCPTTDVDRRWVPGGEEESGAMLQILALTPQLGWSESQRGQGWVHVVVTALLRSLLHR